MKTIKNLIMTFLLFVTIISTAQDWTRVQNLTETQFTALEIIDGVIFAASGNKLYYSSDNGEHWQESIIALQPLYPVCIKKFRNTLYIGMTQGIYAASFDNLSGTWVKSNVQEVSSLVEYNGSLYVSTMGFGIYKLNQNNAWEYFMNGLPNYSFNVSKLVATSQSLIATAGGNGTFYQYDFAQNIWIEKRYSTTYLPGLSIDDAIFMNNKLFVSNGRKLLRSDNFGNTWTPDQSGLLYGLSRFMYKGAKYLYTYTPNFDPGTNDNFTYLRKRSISAPNGSTWNNDSDFLPFYTYAMGELGNKIYAAAENGLYFKIDSTLGTDIPIDDKTQIVIYPNPSKDRRFILNSTLPVDEIMVYDVSGKLLFAQKDIPGLYDFRVPSQGIYLAKVVTGNTVQNFKIIAGS